MDKKLAFLFFTFTVIFLFLQSTGFAEQENQQLSTTLPAEATENHTLTLSEPADPTTSPINQAENLLDVTSSSSSEVKPSTADVQLQELEKLKRSLIQQRQELITKEQQLEQEILQHKNTFAGEKQRLEDKQKRLTEEVLKLNQQKNLLDEQLRKAEQGNFEIAQKQKQLNQQHEQLEYLRNKQQQSYQKSHLELTQREETLLEKEHETRKKLQEIENHWLTRLNKFYQRYFSGYHVIYLLLALVLFFLPFVFLIAKRRKQKISQISAEQNKDYIADNQEEPKGRRKTEIRPDGSMLESDCPPVVQVVEVDGQKIMDRRASRPQNNVVANKPLIWIAIIAIPLLLYFYLIEIGVSKEVATYTGIVAITLIMWMSSLLPEFIPALIGLLLVLLFGLAPNHIVLSGFSSPGFLLLFSVMGLGAVITSSGLTRRYTLWLIKSIPSNLFANQFAIFLTGLVFNPIVPTINGRAMIVAPILRSIVKGWDEKTKSKSATSLYTSGLDGINFLSPIFLTAAPANLMIYGLLPSQEQQAFEFIFWIYAASIVGIVMFFLYFLVTAIFFRSFTSVQISKQEVEEEWRKLGSLKWCEWIAFTGIILMAVGIATSSIHKVPIPLITFGVLCAVLVIGVLSRDQFIKQIDWSFLVLLASMIGILATMSYLGIEKTLVTQFSWLGEYMRNDFPMFVLVLTGMILFVRIFIPLNSAILIFAAALLPLATGAGVSAWVVGFIILIMCGTAFFGYQSPYILYFRSLLKGDVPFVDLKYQVFQILLVFVKLAAIYASIPFWTKIGVL